MEPGFGIWEGSRWLSVVMSFLFIHSPAAVTSSVAQWCQICVTAGLKGKWKALMEQTI